MHEDLDIPGPAELEQLADNEAGEGRMPNCQHFRRLARKWREDREDRDVLRHALLQATTEKARARRAELKPAAERMAYAVALQGDHGITLGPLCKAPACAVQALSPFEGAAVIGLATIAVEAEATSGMQYRLKNAGGAPDQKAVPHTVPVRDAIHGTCEVTKVFPGDVVAAERDLQASAPVGVEGETVAGYIDRLGERIRRGMADVVRFGVHGSHGRYMCDLAAEAIAYAADLAQQPAAVDEEMVERGTDAAIAASTQHYPGESAGDAWRRLVGDVLTAALAGQQQGGAPE